MDVGTEGSNGGDPPVRQKDTAGSEPGRAGGCESDPHYSMGAQVPGSAGGRAACRDRSMSNKSAVSSPLTGIKVRNFTMSDCRGFPILGVSALCYVSPVHHCTTEKLWNSGWNRPYDPFRLAVTLSSI